MVWLWLLVFLVLLLLLWLTRKIVKRQWIKLTVWVKSNGELFLGIITLIVTLVYGAWGVRLANRQISISEKQDSTSISIDTFKSLLLKTDKLITLQHEQIIKYDSELGELRKLVDRTTDVASISAKQLHINSQQQKISNTNEDRRYRASINELERATNDLFLYMQFQRKGDREYTDSLSRTQVFSHVVRVVESDLKNNIALLDNDSLYWHILQDVVTMKFFMLNDRWHDGALITEDGKTRRVGSSEYNKMQDESYRMLFKEVFNNIKNAHSYSFYLLRKYYKAPK